MTDETDTDVRIVSEPSWSTLKVAGSLLVGAIAAIGLFVTIQGQFSEGKERDRDREEQKIESIQTDIGSIKIEQARLGGRIDLIDERTKNIEKKIDALPRSKR